MAIVALEGAAFGLGAAAGAYDWLDFTIGTGSSLTRMHQRSGRIFANARRLVEAVDNQLLINPSME